MLCDNFAYLCFLFPWHKVNGSFFIFDLLNGKNINKEINKLYQINAYRVLLTRARQGMVIVVPNGDHDVPPDETRKPEWYDGIYNYLKEVGIKDL